MIDYLISLGAAISLIILVVILIKWKYPQAWEDTKEGEAPWPFNEKKPKK